MRKLSAVLFYACLLVSANSFAEWYAGAGIGQSHVHDACTNHVNHWSATCDNSDHYGGALLGKQVTKTWAVELGYVSLGDVEASAISEVSGGRRVLAKPSHILPPSSRLEKASLKTDGFELSGVYSHSLSKDLSLIGKAGVFRWHSIFNSTIPGAPSYGDRGTGVTYGVGVSSRAHRRLTLRMLLQDYRDVDRYDRTSTVRVDALYHF